jgi:hypothetical protein
VSTEDEDETRDDSAPFGGSNRVTHRGSAEVAAETLWNDEIVRTQLCQR